MGSNTTNAAGANRGVRANRSACTAPVANVLHPSYLRRPTAICPACARTLTGAGKVCKRRDCPGYVQTWMGDQGVRLLENLHSYRGSVAMLTLTPPGADELPWDVAYCAERHGPGERCSGVHGCRVRPSAARAFNESAMRRWSALWNSVRVDCHRKFGAGVVRLLAYAPEPQRRGVIHFHICLGARTPRERKCLRYAARLLSKRAAAHGWGSVDGRPAFQPLKNAAQAASYLSKYLIKSEHSGSLRQLVLNGEAPRRAVYVSSALTASTRCTMRNLRSRRYLWRLERVQYGCREVEPRLAWLRLEAARRQCRRGGAWHALLLVADADDVPLPAWFAPAT